MQGIADIVLVFDDHIELLDYKTDRKKTEQEFLDAYRAQLDLYALAIEKRFAPKPVTYQGNLLVQPEPAARSGNIIFQKSA